MFFEHGGRYMEFLQHLLSGTSFLASGCGPLCDPWLDLFKESWSLIPGKGDTADKLSLLFTILGGLGGFSFFYWLWQKWRKIDTDSKVDELGAKLEQLRKDLIQRVQEQNAALSGRDQPGAREAQVGIEGDIVTAIATLVEAGKTEALAALERGDTAAADAALAAKIKSIENARIRVTKEEAALYRQRGALAYLNAPLAALPLYAKAVELDKDDPSGWYELATLQWRTGALDDAAKSFELQLEVSQRQSNKRTEALAANGLGVICLARGETERAEALTRSALEIADALKDKYLQCGCTANLGLINWQNGNLDLAEALSDQALSIAVSLGDTAIQAAVTENLGIIYGTRGDLDAARAAYCKALKLNEALEYDEGFATLCGNFAASYAARGDLDQAESFYCKALAIDEMLGNKRGIAKNSGSLGHVYKMRGDITQACKHWQYASHFWDEIGNTGEVAICEEQIRQASHFELTSP